MLQLRERKTFSGLNIWIYGKVLKYVKIQTCVVEDEFKFQKN